MFLGVECYIMDIMPDNWQDENEAPRSDIRIAPE